MKSVLLIALALACCLAIVDGQRGIQRCPDVCPLNYDPVCGFNGRCVQLFSNQCDLANTNCRIRRRFSPVDIILCQIANRRGGRIRYC